MLGAGTLYYIGIVGLPCREKAKKDPLLLAAEQGWTIEEAVPH